VTNRAYDWNTYEGYAPYDTLVIKGHQIVIGPSTSTYDEYIQQRVALYQINGRN
jgi:hypothetical protein